jgi:O-methyltransferase
MNAVMQNAPVQNYQWLRMLLPRRLQPFIRGIRKQWLLKKLALEEPFASVYPFTVVSPDRQKNLLKLGETIEREKIPGAVVECGVLDGGTSALMAFATAQSGRPVHMFDSWSGLPKSTAEDKEEGKKWEGQLVGSQHRVMKCMEKLKIDQQRLNFHVGWFHETFPKTEVPTVALLHIDCDYYEPTKLCLDTWYPRLAPGGFIQFDDYEAFVGCRTAVDEFLLKHPELQLQTFGERGAAYYLRKPHA